MRLEGKYILITGAGSGIGRMLAIEASQRGSVVALCGRRNDALAATAGMLDQTKHNLVLPADVMRPVSRRRLYDQIAQKWGRLDVLVNNAGILEAGQLERLADEALERAFATNVVAPIALARDFLPLLSVGTPSRIVNIGSVFGDIPYPLFAVYSATKFALRGFSTALRRELRDRGVGVTYAAPRATKTDAASAVAALIEPMRAQLDSPAQVAKLIWRAVERDADSVYPVGPERLFVFAQRLLPRLVDGVIAKQMSHLIANENGAALSSNRR